MPVITGEIQFQIVQIPKSKIPYREHWVSIPLFFFSLSKLKRYLGYLGLLTVYVLYNLHALRSI